MIWVRFSGPELNNERNHLSTTWLRTISTRKPPFAKLVKRTARKVRTALELPNPDSGPSDERKRVGPFLKNLTTPKLETRTEEVAVKMKKFV